ncbi:MAG TPA: taurine catabolism dioxygenase TauD [Cyanobacteria bacterium UBA11162]|nr:taurine catabolism dioxygenase TauD [Cyanobacteria bacterium UBA11162]
MNPVTETFECPTPLKSYLFKPDSYLPLVIESEGMSLIELWDWLTVNKSWLDQTLLKHGGLLFRGFPLSTPQEFDQFIHTIEPTTRPYIEGQSQRTKIHQQIYTSTEYPADQNITLHNELSYTSNPPRRLFFFCQIAPQEGGETPITDCRKVYDKMNLSRRDRFINKKVRYVKTMHNGKGFGKSWQQHFETSDPAKVEQYLQQSDVNFGWKENGTLVTSQVRPSVLQHPESGEMCWFNQADLWHYTNLGAIGDELVRLLGEENLPTNAYYGDGTPIQPEDLSAIRQLFWNEATLFTWHQGDVLILDNRLTAHGRKAFKGERRILVAMA